ncbi:hypothetical protein COV94_05885, partial [Candidatus Woesearchaeota archaeon CG11_big_fil_rev_8_21_14_0_20_57_5]
MKPTTHVRRLELLAVLVVLVVMGVGTVRMGQDGLLSSSSSADASQLTGMVVGPSSSESSTTGIGEWEDPSAYYKFNLGDFIIQKDGKTVHKPFSATHWAATPSAAGASGEITLPPDFSV